MLVAGAVCVLITAGCSGGSLSRQALSPVGSAAGTPAPVATSAGTPSAVLAGSPNGRPAARQTSRAPDDPPDGTSPPTPSATTAPSATAGPPAATPTPTGASPSASSTGAAHGSSPGTRPAAPPPRAPAVTPAPERKVPAPTGPTAKAQPCPGTRCLTIAVTGDVLLHPQLVDQARLDGNGQLDFFPMLAGQQPYVQGADIGICHLETPLAPPGGPFSGYPSFSVPPQVLTALKTTGYDACSTASNHTFDQGTVGVNRTLDDLDAAGILHDGSYRTERDAGTPLVINTGHGRLALISASYDWNGATPDHPWQANAIDPPAIIAKAKAARAAGADLVVVALHAGEEYQVTPNAQQKQAAKALLADPNIDLVYGHHAHVVQPMEKINGKWAIYGLGNNIAAQSTEVTGTRDGLLVRVQFSRGADGRWTTSDVAWVPSRQDVGPPYHWCPLTAGPACSSRAEDSGSLQRTTSAVTMWGADSDGARRM